MTWKEKFLRTKKWHRKSIIIALYYRYYAMRKQKKSVRTCAKYFGMSTGYISEAIKIGDNYKLIKHCKNREEALSILRGIL